MIDHDRLAELKAEIGEEDFADVAELFVAEIEEVMARLAAGPADATPADFHFLRGSAANLGFVAFAESCASAETQTQGGAMPDIAALDGVFRACIRAAERYLPESLRAA